MLEQQNCEQNHGLFLFKVINLKLLFTASVQYANSKLERRCGVKEHILKVQVFTRENSAKFESVLSLINTPNRGRCLRLASLKY